MHSSSSRKPVALLASAAVLFALVAPGAARADGVADVASAGVGVARISVIQGAVAVQRGDSATPSAAVINTPVLGADYVTTGDGARAEVQLDGTSAVRLGANVQMRFTHLDTGDRELQLAAGTLDLRLLRGADGRSQIDTPSISIRPRGAGSYRVSVDSGGHTQVTVRSGSADVVTPQSVQVLVSGTTLLAQGAAADPSISSIAAIAYDDFDRFNRDRDDREERALADAAYAAPGVAGIDDLDAYGRWVNDGGYGRVWVPTYVASSWAPYRDGRWVWEDGYGWTWIGYEPWGWAPYHYGRWYHSTAYGWCWYPQRTFVVWRPAIVAFLSFGSVGFGFGDIGWVPLAPFEAYVPWWGNRYGTVVNNVTYVTNNYYVTNGNVNNGTVTNNNTGPITRIYGNAKYNGVTYVAHQRFLEGRFEHLRSVDPARLREVHVVRGVVPVVPSDANLRFSAHPVAPELAGGSALLGRTFAGNAVTVQRTPFAQQREALASAAHVNYVERVPAKHVPVTTGTTTTVVPANTPRDTNAARAARAASGVRDVNVTHEVNDPWARFGASRGTPVTHAANVSGTAPGGATTSTTSTTAGTTRGNVTVIPRNAHDAEVWNHFDPRTPVQRQATATHESRESNAQRAAVQQPAPQHTAAQPHPQPRTEHPKPPANSTKQ